VGIISHPLLLYIVEGKDKMKLKELQDGDIFYEQGHEGTVYEFSVNKFERSAYGFGTDWGLDESDFTRPDAEFIVIHSTNGKPQ
jgi:hypothetical protein